MTADVFNLRRFVLAQDPDYGTVVRELEAGRKRGHWIWYIFPQIRGLGGSAMSRKYAISGRDEARAYCEHPTLGPRLRECTQLVLDIEGRALDEIFPPPDDLKFRSCMTLFGQSAPDPTLFRAALLEYCAGKPDTITLQILDGQNR
jgi:uncharacterized protein (DUF1810 family)